MKKVSPEAFHKSLKSRSVCDVAGIEFALISDFTDINFSQSDLKKRKVKRNKDLEGE